MPLGVQPTIQELTDAIRLLANGKAVGLDGVSVKLSKITLDGDPALRRRLLDIVVCIWRGGGEVPHQWKYIIMVFHKNKERIECGNYRGISMVAHAGNILLKIIAHCLSEYCECMKILSEEQRDFGPNRCTTDTILVICLLQMKACGHTYVSTTGHAQSGSLWKRTFVKKGTCSRPSCSTSFSWRL